MVISHSCSLTSVRQNSPPRLCEEQRDEAIQQTEALMRQKHVPRINGGKTRFISTLHSPLSTLFLKKLTEAENSQPLPLRSSKLNVMFKAH